MKTIALALNIKELQYHFRDKEVCRKYPGAGFLPHLAKMADARGWGIIGSAYVRGSSIPIGDVYVLQEELEPCGLELSGLGAKAQVLFCMESKMYAPYFYDMVPQLKNLFKYQILFDGGTHKMLFPSYDREELLVERPLWADRKDKVCIISSNKQWWSMPHHFDSPSWCSAIRNELHTERLRAIETMDVDLYGHGWDNLGNIPPHWAFLRSKIRACWKGPVEDKLKTLSQYRYTSCHENTREPGYVTEKEVHAMIAGTLIRNSRPYDSGWNTHLRLDYSNEKFAEQVMGLMDENS